MKEIVDPIGVHTNRAIKRRRSVAGAANGVVFVAVGGLALLPGGHGSTALTHRNLFITPIHVPRFRRRRRRRPSATAHQEHHLLARILTSKAERRRPNPAGSHMLDEIESTAARELRFGGVRGGGAAGESLHHGPEVGRVGVEQCGRSPAGSPRSAACRLGHAATVGAEAESVPVGSGGGGGGGWRGTFGLSDGEKVGVVGL
ncbi:cysteine proteinases superfamily protein [Striga asiatica]|uniref:Cysteine proteinases superfamily protein n=1 Tax=Striga asiatica TaxID=4170 RepID=A0A5A7R979_STRAF|nr:cysteine proteinases superfamily protein [Striga asiatica]